MSRRFPRKKKGDNLSHGHVNDLSGIAAKFDSMVPGSFITGLNTSSKYSASGRPPFDMFTAFVVDTVAGTGDTASSGLYQVYLKYYEATKGRWIIDSDKTWVMDERGSNSSPPGYSVGDSVQVYWDEQAGVFIPVGSGAGSGAASIRFEIIAPGPYLGDLEIECDYVVAEVLGVPCQSAGVQVGDEINVWDPDNCHFNLPIELLYGVRGRAIQMANDLDGVIDCYDIRAQDGSCRWEVIGLCCTEEIYGNT